MQCDDEMTQKRRKVQPDNVVYVYDLQLLNKTIIFIKNKS